MLRIDQKIYEEICRQLKEAGSEHGGVLGAGEDGTVRHFYFDATGVSSANGYKPDTNAINNMLISDWLPSGIRMVGIVHSHSDGCKYPSCGDVAYAYRILDALAGIDSFHIPIYTDGVLNGYEAVRMEGQMLCRSEELRIL